MKNVSLIILNKNIKEVGLAANLGFVLALSAAKDFPEDTFGPEVKDGDGSIHPPLTNIGHYVRKASPTKLAKLRNEFANIPEVTLVDYTEDAAPSDYSEYEKSLEKKSGEDIVYRAIHVYGPLEIIEPLTKSLSRA